MKLHSYWRSSCSWRVRIALELKALPYELVPVNLLEGAQRTPDYRARNPMGQVPALEVEVDGATVSLAQSLPIIHYLDEVHPTPPLLPEHPLERQRARALAEIINSGIQPLQNLAVGQYLKAHQSELGVRTWSRHFVEKGFVALEAALQPTAGTYSVGDQVTLPDICLVPQVYNARRFELDLAPFPTITAIEANLAKLPAFEAAHPDRQPDAPPGS
ncbi:MAG: maleylacetoacetate isomerase [Myxococcota bacterium]